ncbi:ABC transporter ATP-binding protein [Aurantiacibacter spongiae]|uniref:ABC transporter ATP-binding protein n=1 Tax=Aurantiacibacter spongiae TaxID=2488860 RepID=A0A3N5CVM1_9SPHN|nr:ABC transporter ATP-binding protein [Aurantiacibacter spongiae]RPF71530.1 ABC transporter ATP-binding protein [Aurantiacibacter spongiae]
MNSLRFILELAQPYRKSLVGISVLTLAGSIFTLSIPWLAGQLLGGVIADRAPGIPLVVILLVGALVATTGLQIGSTILSAATSGHILADLRLQAYRHVQTLPQSFHDRSRQGEMLTLITFEVAMLSTFLTSTLATVPSLLLTAAGAVVLLFLIDPAMALFVPVLVPLFYILAKLAGRRLRVLSRRARMADADVVVAAETNLDMLPAIKAFAIEDARAESYSRALERARLVALSHSRIDAALAPAMGLLAALAAIGLVLTAGARFEANRDPGDLFSFLFYAALLARPVGGLANLYGQFQWAKGTLTRLRIVLSRDPEPGYAAGERPSRIAGSISFQDVHFSYPGRTGPLRGASLDIEKGEIVALTGANGAGKSTLVKLLTRFYEPQRGTILLDDTDIAAIHVQHLRRAIGMVPQRPLLFDGTLRENITLGIRNVDPDRLNAAIDLAQARDLVSALPEGLETRIGDHGVRLSGGQGQRIGLARALIGNPPILVLDEATSMYDLESEAAFVKDCMTALVDRTVIIITHRAATLALADRVAVVENGVIRTEECRPTR